MFLLKRSDEIKSLNMRKDIENREDIEVLIQLFYSRLLKDPLMLPHFAHTDFVHHTPRIVGFWAFVLLDEPMKIGNVFDAHRHLKVDDHHFERWIQTFSTTVDELFEGKIANKAKQNAEVIGFTFASKLKNNKQF
jgi:hemoglobin